jgi:hypothetical protein
MKRSRFMLILLLMLTVTLPAVAADFAFHGDMNNRFLLYTNRQDWLTPEQQGKINSEDVDENYGELKYRFWFDAATNDNKVKGVYAIEIGGIRFGREGSGKGQGGSFSGDGANVETRWAYLDLQIPNVETLARFRMGLMPVDVNEFLWQETAAGVIYDGQPNDFLAYQLGWIRGIDRLDSDLLPSSWGDQDNFLLRFNLMSGDSTNVGLFGLYQTGDAQDTAAANNNVIAPRSYLLKQFAGTVEHQIYTIGVDGGTKYGTFFVNWNLMYQGGDFDNVIYDDATGNGVSGIGPLPARDYDLKAYFGGVDLGLNLGKGTLTGTFWYASGDDNPNDDEFNGFLATDLDRADNIGIFEGLFTDDATYFTERPYLLDKGFVMLKLAYDHQLTEKLKLGGAGMYMETAEDITYTDFNGNLRSNSDVGFEFDAYATYMIFPNVEWSVNVGYLFAGDALDAFEVGDLRDGKSDEDIWGSSMRIRYKF